MLFSKLSTQNFPLRFYVHRVLSDIVGTNPNLTVLLLSLFTMKCQTLFYRLFTLQHVERKEKSKPETNELLNLCI